MNVSDLPSDWSDDLKAQTRDVIDGYVIIPACDGQVCLKHITTGSGTVAVDNLVRGVLRVVNRRTGFETTFANADELLAAGWVID